MIISNLQLRAAAASRCGARLERGVAALASTLEPPRQGRSQWDQAAISAGMRYFVAAIRGGHLTYYHIEAAIAATHAGATNVETIDWLPIARHYGQACDLYPSPLQL